MKFLTAILGIALLSIASAILPDKCSVEHCGTNGAAAPCTQTFPFEVTKCAAWANTLEAKIQCKKLDCTGQSCYFIPLLASDGELYCTPCHIHQVSCKTGFKVFGPVGSGPFGSAVSRQKDSDSEPVSVEAIDVVSRNAEKGFNIDESPVSRKVVLCSMKFCTRRGALARCSFVLPKGALREITCFKFSFLPQSIEECSFFCPLFCLPEDQQPIANTGKKFCSECQLRQESCRTRYKTFGPVTPSAPTAE